MKRKHLLWLCLIPALVLAKGLPDPKQFTSPVQWLKTLLVETSGLLDKWVSRIDLTSDDHYETYDVVKKEWCPRIGNSPVEQISDMIGMYCTAHDGVWRSPFCLDSKKDRINFAATTEYASVCSSIPGVHVDMYVPKTSEQGNDFAAAMYELGFRTEDQKKEEEAQALARSIENQRLERQREEANVARAKVLAAERAREEKARVERAKRELPQKKLKGSRICKTEHGVDYVGFTEDYSAQTDKIQVRVSSASRWYGEGQFQQKIIWDWPDNWQLCE